MREFNDRTSWEGARSEVLYTVSVLEASAAHDRTSRALRSMLERWGSVDAAKRSAEDGVVRSHAGVAWADHVMDQAVRGFANELLRDTIGDAKHPTFATFFPEAPNEVIRLGLESEIERCERFAPLAKKVKLSKTATAKLAEVEHAIAAGRSAVGRRKDAFLTQAQAALDVAAWKQSANAARVSAYVQLQAWAVENREDRVYADRFFPAGATRKAKRGEEKVPNEEKPVG